MYEVYINSEPTGQKFPKTWGGFFDALECAEKTPKPFRLDVIHVVNESNVDMNCPNGLTELEIDTAYTWRRGDYV